MDKLKSQKIFCSESFLVGDLRLLLNCSSAELEELLADAGSSVGKGACDSTALSITELTQLADLLHVPLEDFDPSRPNWVKVGAAANAYFQRGRLGESWFERGGFSRFRTAINAVKFLEKKRDSLSALLLTRRLGLDPQFFTDPSFERRSVPIELIARVFDESARMGLDQKDFYQMGLQTGLRFQKGGSSPLSLAVKSARSLAEIYESILGEHTHFFDENHEYWVHSVTPDQLVFRSVPSKRAQDEQKSARVGSAIGCIQRSGAAAAFPAHGGRGVTRVRHPRCIFRGDPFCEFEVELKNPVTMLSRSNSLSA